MMDHAQPSHEAGTNIHASPRTSRLAGLPPLLMAMLLAGGLSVPDAQAIDLLQSYQLAIDNDARYQAARFDAAASREAEPQALAQLLPNVGMNLAGSKRATGSWSPNMFGQASYRHQNYDSSNYAINLRQPIYRPYNFALYKQAGYQVESAEANLDRNLQDMMVRLSEAYFDALMAEDTLKLALAQKDAYAAQRSYAERRFQSGQGTRTDIDDTQARYDMALANELEARQNVDYTKRQLQVLINQPVSQLDPLAAERIEFIPPMPANVDDWVQRGIEVNAELRAMRANIEAAAAEVSKASAGHHPTVDLVVQRSRNESDSETNINQTYLTSSLGVQVNIPLFAGGYVNSQVRQAEASLNRVRQQYEARRREIDMLIRKEFQNVTQGVLKVRAQEQSRRSAEQAVYSNQKGYQAGTRTLIDVLNAEQQRMNVRRDLTNARHQYIVARIRLQSLVGSLNEEELKTVNGWLDHSTTAPARASAARATPDRDAPGTTSGVSASPFPGGLAQPAESPAESPADSGHPNTRSLTARLAIKQALQQQAANVRSQARQPRPLPLHAFRIASYGCFANSASATAARPLTAQPTTHLSFPLIEGCAPDHTES